MWSNLFLSLESSFQLSHPKQPHPLSLASQFFDFSPEKQCLSFCIWFMPSAVLQIGCLSFFCKSRTSNSDLSMSLWLTQMTLKPATYNRLKLYHNWAWAGVIYFIWKKEWIGMRRSLKTDFEKMTEEGRKKKLLEFLTTFSFSYRRLEDKNLIICSLHPFPFW